MNRLIQFAIACCFSLGVFAANPSFQSFNTNQFDVTGNHVALKDGLIVTNLTLTGAGAGNLFEVYNESNVLKFWVDTDGFSYPQIWTNNAGTIQATSTVADGASAVGFSLNSSNTLSTAGAMLGVLKNGGDNTFRFGSDGGIKIGKNATSVISGQTIGGIGLAILGDLSLGDPFVQIDMALRATPAATDRSDFFIDLGEPGAPGSTLQSYARYLDSGTGVNSVLKYNIGANDIDWWMQFNSSVPTEIWPSNSGGQFIAKFGSIITHTSGNLVEVYNNYTNKFSIDYLGAVIPSGNTNQITTGSGRLKFDAVNVVTASSTDALTEKTFNAASSGNVLSQIKSLKLQFPRLVDGAGCTYANTNDYTALTFMLPQFSGTAATNVNFCQFAFRVPKDLDTSVDLTGSLTIRLTAADTAAHAYTVGMVSIANSSSAAGTAANYVTLTVGADGSGASGDIENVNDVTLTGWRSNMTAGQWCLVQLQRDGSDSSTVASNLMELEIFYTSTQ